MDKSSKKEWLQGFIRHHSGKSIVDLKENKEVLKGYSKENKSNPLFVYADEFSHLISYFDKTKYLLTEYSSSNLTEIERNWSELCQHKHVILCLVDFNNENYALLKPYAHSMIVEKEHLKKSIKGLMSP